MNYFDFNTFYFTVLCGIALGFLTYFEFWHDKIEGRYPRGVTRKRMMFLTMLALMLCFSCASLGVVIMARFLTNSLV